MNANSFPPLYGNNRDAAAIMGVSLAGFMQQPNGLRWHPEAPKPVAVAEGARELQFLPAWVEFAYRQAGATPPPYGLAIAYLTSQPVADARLRARPRQVGADGRRNRDCHSTARRPIARANAGS